MTAITKEVKVGGKSNYTGSLKTAQLCLKNRVNKSQRQRIIMFVGSPIQDDSEELLKVAKNLKKNNVAVDIINFGAEAQDNVEKLDTFLNAVNNSDNSHLVNIPPGPHVLSDLVLTSAVLSSDSGMAAVPGVAAPTAHASGSGEVDPNTDPELALALRESMEEARQKEEKKTTDKTAKDKDKPAVSTTAASSGKPSSTAATSTSPPVAATATAMDETDDEELRQALQMSMGAEDQATTSKDTSHTDSKQVSDTEFNMAIHDPDFMNSLLSSVPGVNPEDLALDDILSQLTETSKDDNKPKDSKTKDSKGPGTDQTKKK